MSVDTETFASNLVSALGAKYFMIFDDIRPQ